MKKKILNKEFQRMKKLAGIIDETYDPDFHYINEMQDNDEQYDDFMDTLLTLAVERGVLNQRNIDALNRGDAPELMGILESIWRMYESYAESGQAISTSDYNNAVERLDKAIYSAGERSRDYDEEDIFK